MFSSHQHEAPSQGDPRHPLSPGCGFRGDPRSLQASPLPEARDHTSVVPGQGSHLDPPSVLLTPQVRGPCGAHRSPEVPSSC
ncbi:hypothetical protein NDU88_005328 [Pleurodeles waltl]|uniref:Uncharacterized protein n=1 Tax=Pleurodeles waltl TaxID=8319 RepID=A0AAV7TVB2_PLEWA|nr:hypothetical protein NDU88_005328 [Pleurodeles waltl]